MITQGLISLVLGLLSLVLDVLPDIAVDVSGGVYNTFMDLVSGVLYLLPTGTIMTIFSIIFSIWVFKILISLPKALWELLPFV